MDFPIYVNYFVRVFSSEGVKNKNALQPDQA